MAPLCKAWTASVRHDIGIRDGIGFDSVPHREHIHIFEKRQISTWINPLQYADLTTCHMSHVFSVTWNFKISSCRSHFILDTAIYLYPGNAVSSENDPNLIRAPQHKSYWSSEEIKVGMFSFGRTSRPRKYRKKSVVALNGLHSKGNLSVFSLQSFMHLRHLLRVNRPVFRINRPIWTKPPPNRKPVVVVDCV